MSTERAILRAIKWNKENRERHTKAVKKCSKRLFEESKQLNLFDYKLPFEVEIKDRHRCYFNGISYHIGNGGYIIANKDIGKDKNGKRKYKAHKLHRDLWEFYHKKSIPENCNIHHIDGNVTNNLIDNLMLVNKDEHKILHNKKVRA